MNSLKAIIVDDDEIDRDVTRRLLNRTGAFDTIFECLDGTQIDRLLGDREKFDKHFSPRPPPALVFLDLNMPKMNGFEVLDAIEQRQKFKPFDVERDCLVMVVSTSNLSEDKQKALSYQFVKEYIVKPMTQSRLDDVISRWYQDSQADPELSPSLN